MTYIFTITYNFDSDYIAKKCNTYDEALAILNQFLSKEVKTVIDESEYTPSVLKWTEDDITLVYAEGYTVEGCMTDALSRQHNGNDYATKDCAYYRIFEVEA